MASVNVQETIKAPAEQVWEILADFGNLSKWADPELIASCESNGSEIGDIRIITLVGGESIQERIEILEPSSKRLSYSILGNSPLPVNNYLSTIKVTSKNSDECLVDWQSTFESIGPQDEAETTIREIYLGGCRGIRKALGI